MAEENTPVVPAVASPAAPPPAKSIVDEYELGDTTHEAPEEASAPVAATAAPAVESPSPQAAVAADRPRDPDTGRFLPKGTHSPRIRQMALDFGLSDSEIDQTEPGALENTVYHLHRQALALQRDNDRQRLLLSGGEVNAPLVSPMQDGAQPPTPTPPAEDDLGINEADYDPGLVGIIKRQQKQLKELQATIGQLQQGEQRRQVMTIAAQCDRAFQKHKAILGEGRGADMTAEDPNFVRRKAVLGLVQSMKAGSLPERIDKAVEMLFGTAASPQASPREQPRANGTNRIAEKDWDEAALARPTHRAGAPEPKGRALAEKSVARALKELEATESDLPEDSFLD